jgi:hypothetical protein
MKWWLVPLLLFCTSAFALYLEEMSFDERVRQASVVLIGTVERVQPRVHSRHSTYALVKVESLLKGTASDSVCVLTRHPDAEQSFTVTAGRRYLFLLTRDQDCYRSVNGHFAVIPVDGEPS